MQLHAVAYCFNHKSLQASSSSCACSCIVAVPVHGAVGRMRASRYMAYALACGQSVRTIRILDRVAVLICDLNCCSLPR
jgi:hypothetical protein